MAPTRRFTHRKAKRISGWPASAAPKGGVAARAKYVGSPEHKDYPSSAGAAALKSDNARCAVYKDFRPLVQALRDAIISECVSEQFEAGFPRFVWSRFDGKMYEARHIGGNPGQYKAYEIGPENYPRDPKGLLKAAKHS